jgi:RHS repeat-associated protein
MLQSRRKAGVVLFAIVCVVGGGLARHWRRGAPAREARRIVSALRERPSWPLQWDLAGELRAEHRATSAVPVSNAPRRARITVPERSTNPLRVEDVTTGMTIDVQVRGVFSVAAQSADGYFVYPHAHASGGTLLHRVLEDGAEDFVNFETRPAVPEVTYDLTLAKEVSGLRLVEGTLEMLDDDGAPRLRATPPFILGADGVRTDATLAVEGCAVDTNPAAPWGRDLTPPGAETCTLRVRWPDEQVKYPAVLDPRWQTTGGMNVARQDHVALLLSTGKVLVVGGRSTATTTGLASAELFDRTTSSWSVTGSMTTGGRYQFTATQLGTNSNSSTSAHVLAAGGTNAGVSLNTAQLYSVSAGTWAAVAANLPAARSSHTGTLLASGKVLLAGGVSGSSVLNTAVLYDPSTGTGTWTSTGNMPQAVKGHTATLLAVPANGTLNNKVIVVGGNSGTASVGNVQLFDGTGTWSSLAALASTREGHTATALVNGNVLITGGKSGSTALNITQLFNAASGSGSWASAGTMTAARQLHTATLLPAGIVANGQVLLTGGNNSAGTLNTTELWNGTSTWTATTALTAAVQGQTATLLSNNMVLIAGGVNGSTTVTTAGLYDASFSLACTSNSQCTTGFCVSGVCCDTACNGGCGACNLAGKVGTCSAAPSSTVCRAQNGACDVAEKCNGTATTCPTDSLATAATVCRVAAGECDVAEQCTGSSSACPADTKRVLGTACTADSNSCTKDQCDGTNVTCQHPVASDGTTCNDGISATAIDTCRSGTCVGTGDPAAVLGFESLGQWTSSLGGAIVGLNSNRTQGSESLEVAAQGYQPLVSLPMATLGNVGPLVLLDILLPTNQANPGWFGDVQMFVNAPSVGIYNQYLGITELNGLPLATWQTLAFQLTNQQVAALSGSYDDLTFTIAINVDPTEKGHYLLDNLRFDPGIFPTVVGVAQNSAGDTEAIFTYQTTAPANIPYGPANFLADQNGFIHTPSDLPPQQFVPTAHAPFAVTLPPPQLTWTVGANSATAYSNMNPLPTSTQPDGTKVANLPDGTQIPLDANPALANAIVPSDTSYTTFDKDQDALNATLGNGPNIGPTSAGTLPGAFQVTNDGAAQYTLPLETPHGRNGVEPHLALIYNSRSGSGLLGPGWALQGLHRIGRCKRSYGVGQELGTDPHPVTYTSGDDLCLDGERLVPFGAAGGEYRTKKDQQAKVLVTASDANGPLSFTIYRKDGTIEYYGLDSSTRGGGSRIGSINGTLPGAITYGLTPVTREWDEAKVVDRFGNTMTVAYQSLPATFGPSDNLQKAPGTISYTSNPNTGRSATNTITFSYTNLGSTVVKLESGLPFYSSGMVLSKIEIKAPNPVAPSLVTSYKMTYQTHSITSRPLLGRIQRCGGDGVCLAPTVFDWSQGAYQFQKSDSGITDFHPSTQNWGDVAGFAMEAFSRWFVVGDFDGDGKDDLMYRESLPSSTNGNNEMDNLLNAGIRMAFGGVNGFESKMYAGILNNSTIVKSGDPFNNNQYFGYPSNQVNPPIAADLTGDGKLDLIMTTQQVQDGVIDQRRYDLWQGHGRDGFTALPTDLSFNGPSDPFSDPNLNPTENTDRQIFGPIVVGDLNGDGLTDIARQLTVPGSTGYLLGARFGAENNPGPQYQIHVDPPGFIPWNDNFGGRESAAEIVSVDVDGDGRTEIIMSTAGDTTIGVHGTRAKFLETVPTNVPPTATIKLALDVNGDGLRDLVLGVNDDSSAAPMLWMNTGNGFYPFRNVDTAILTGLVADLNGDGMDDVLVPGCSPTANGPPAQAYISNGNGTFTVQTLPIPSGLSFVVPQPTGGTVCPHALLDIDGDGQKDFVQPEAGTDQLQVYYRKGGTPDKIKTITNGVRANTVIGYSRVTGNSSDVCSYPQSCGGRNTEVVATYQVDEGHVEPSQNKNTPHSMTYTAPTADLQGAGWVGFGTITDTNGRTNATYVKTFDVTTRIGDWFPFAGLPQTETSTVTLQGTGRVMSRQKTTTYQTIQSDPNNALGSYSVVPQTVSSTETEQVPGQPAASPQRSTEEIYTYDDLANVTTYQINHIVDGSNELKVYGVTNDKVNWLIGQVGSVTDTSSTPLNGSDTRSATYQIDSTTGAVMGATVEPGDPIEQLATTYLRNGDGLIYSTTATPTSGPPRTTLVTYDSIEGAWPAAYTNALWQVTRVAYHCGLGLLATISDPNGVTTQWQYDTLGRIRGTSEASGGGTSVHYSRPDATSIGVIASWADTAGRTGQTVSDELLREISRSETAFDGSHQLTSTRSYDAASGRVGIVSQPFGANGGSVNPNAKWTRIYDEIGRVTESQPPNSSFHDFVYAGLKTTELVGGNEKGYTVSDELNRVVLSSQVEPTSPSPNHEIQTAFDYGPFGALKHVHAPNGATTTMSYDHLGHRTDVLDLDSGDRSVTYNSFGEVVGEELPGQTPLAYGRDSLGRETSIEQGTDLTSFNFDAAANGIGRLESQVSATGVITRFAYQSTGVPQSTTYTVNGNDYRFDWTYSPSGRLSQIAYPGNGGAPRFTATIGYGSDGRIGSLVATNSGSTLWQRTSVSDDGHLFQEAFGNGLSTIHDHDPLSGRVTHLSTGSGAVVPETDGSDTFQNRIQSLGYTYYPDGTMLSRTDYVLGANEGFAYDNVNRVKNWSTSVSEDQVQYGYDDSGNLTTRTDTNPGGVTLESYNYGERGAGPHAITTGPAGSYSYDSSGRQISNPGASTIAYTYFDLPAMIQSSSGVVSFTYDALGQRVEKKTSTTDDISVGGLYERRSSSSGDVNVFYLPGDTSVLGEIVCTDDGNCAAPVFFHPDLLGTIDTATSGGVVVGREKRDPFGRSYSVVNMSGPDPGVAFGFIGEMEDPETSFVNLNHRIYDPRTGRFLSPDPLVKNFSNGQDYNRYSYAENNPLSFVDPSGLEDTGPPSDPGPSADTTGVPDSDKPFLVGELTTDPDGVTTRYTTFDPSLVPGGQDAYGFPGDPTGPFEALVPIGNGPALPNVGALGQSGQGGTGQGGTTYPLPGGGRAPSDRVYAQFFIPPPWLSGGSETQQRDSMNDAAEFAVIGTAGGAALMLGGTAALRALAPPLTLAIGRLGAPAAAFATFGYEYLEVCKECWNPTVNAMIIRGAIEDGYRFYLASPATFENFFDELTGDMTVFGYEFAQLLTDGFKLRGDFLVR